MNCWKSWLWRFWSESARNPDVADIEASVPIPPPGAAAPARCDESSEAPASESDMCIIEEQVAPERPPPPALAALAAEAPVASGASTVGGEANTLGANTMARLLLDMFTRDACEATSRKKSTSARSSA